MVQLYVFCLLYTINGKISSLTYSKYSGNLQAVRHASPSLHCSRVVTIIVFIYCPIQVPGVFVFVLVLVLVLTVIF
jgi:hypothetical protein